MLEQGLVQEVPLISTWLKKLKNKREKWSAGGLLEQGLVQEVPLPSTWLKKRKNEREKWSAGGCSNKAWCRNFFFDEHMAEETWLKKRKN